MITLYHILVGVSIAWLLCCVLTLLYVAVWTLRHPRRRFIPPPPRPPTEPFSGTLRHNTLPSVEPTRKLRNQALRREEFDNWLARQSLVANPHIVEMSEWKNAHVEAKG